MVAKAPAPVQAEVITHGGGHDGRNGEDRRAVEGDGEQSALAARLQPGQQVGSRLHGKNQRQPFLRPILSEAPKRNRRKKG